ncbi:MAG: glycosyltransferase [Alphaproteobacteria bacterium]|nr:glycosyltransferase [Alphaproteobacteria bacterium]
MLLNDADTCTGSLGSCPTQDVSPPAALPHLRDLRLALFSGNYNCVTDGANQALNRLVAFLEAHGAAVRVYSPTVENPAFDPAGTLVSLPSVPVPKRPEYRIALSLPKSVQRDLDGFRPNVVHISAPDVAGYLAVRYARARGITAVASVHTRFDTYLGYYRLGALEGLARAYLRHLYSRCSQVYAPSPCMIDTLRADRIESDIRLWSRGVDRERFSPRHRDPAWRQANGWRPEDVVILFVGRLVLEKGLDTFARAVEQVRHEGSRPKVLVVGDGPAAGWFHNRLPEAVFTGHLSGASLSRAYASSDIFFNPSRTETFGNVTLEAMASGLPTVCAQSTGSTFLVRQGVTGFLVDPRASEDYAHWLARLVSDPELRRRTGRGGLRASGAFEWNEVMLPLARGYRAALDAQHRHRAPAAEISTHRMQPSGVGSAR